MKVLVAMNALKGTLDTVAAGTVIARTWRSLRPDDSITLLPLADGGDGTIDAVIAAGMGTLHDAGNVTGPDGRATSSAWVELVTGDILVELALCSGISRMSELDAMNATTRGLGETIAAAMRHRTSQNYTLFIALGGSASTDAGLGALRALGLEATDVNGAPIPEGAAGLSSVARLDRSAMPPAPARVVLLTDVRSPLLGPHGSIRFAPQKGAATHELPLITAGLTNLVDVMRSSGLRVAREPGAGAAGGTAFGFSSLWGARYADPYDFLFGAFGLDRIVASHDLVITGEGRFDSSSLAGKAPGRIIEAARQSTGATHAAVLSGSIDWQTFPTDVTGIELADATAQMWAKRNPIEALATATKTLSRQFD